MELPNGTVLMHGPAPYNPAKAHEYYLRTRELKGRKKGSSTFSVSRPNGRTVNLTTRELTEQRLYAAKRINDIKGKLAELNLKLRDAIREAMDKKVKAGRKADKPATAAEKSKAARESSKYRDKHKQELATKSKRETAKKTATLKDEDPVAELQTKIGEIKKRLSAAVAIQRALTGATKNN